MNFRIGVIGCGQMGGGMVSHMLNSGLDVACYDPDTNTLECMKQLGATPMATATELAQSVNLLILSLPKAAVVEAVMSEITDHLQNGTVILDTSTSVPATSQSMNKLGKNQGFDFVEGPVSGGPAAAKAGNMTMLLAGDKKAVERIRSVIDTLTAKTVFVGSSGAGHAAKIANNMLCAANLVLVSEALRLGKAFGVDAENLLEGINAGSGRSGVSEVNFSKWILSESFDSGFTMGLMRKDVSLVLDLAQESGVSIDGFKNIADIWLSESSEIKDSADFNEITTFSKKA